jgi:hypothetical protein
MLRLSCRAASSIAAAIVGMKWIVLGTVRFSRFMATKKKPPDTAQGGGIAGRGRSRVLRDAAGGGLLLLAACSSYPHVEPKPGDCEQWRESAETLRMTGFAGNVDPAIGWSAFARDAAKSGCPMMPPAMKP